MIYRDGIDLKNNIYCSIYKSNSGILTQFSLSTVKFHDDADIYSLDVSAKRIIECYSLKRVKCTQETGQLQCGIIPGNQILCD